MWGGQDGITEGAVAFVSYDGKYGLFCGVLGAHRAEGLGGTHTGFRTGKD